MEEWVIVHNNRIIKRFKINNGQSLVIGRGPEANIVINHSAISRKHCSLELMGAEYFITDHYSLNGTKINGNSITSAVQINRSDLIELGSFILKPAALLTGKEKTNPVAASPDSSKKTLLAKDFRKKS
ncbi:MAG: FHA domain-containing protein [Proteobacteria bacterium]|nr:FHA domain-containing protein [Pseudomonadota bacterium]MBU1737903.1 FHA domain-containing protein [Pseudomonadota bacterium]